LNSIVQASVKNPGYAAFDTTENSNLTNHFERTVLHTDLATEGIGWSLGIEGTASNQACRPQVSKEHG
jgi:hypothetical protein